MFTVPKRIVGASVGNYQREDIGERLGFRFIKISSICSAEIKWGILQGTPLGLMSLIQQLGNGKFCLDAPHTRDHFQTVIVDDKLYAAGGRNTSAKTGRVLDATIGEVDVFDFNSNSWSTLPTSSNLPTLRAGSATIAHEDRVIIMGGESGTQVTAHSEVEALDVSTGKWSSLPPMLQGRHGTQAILHRGKVYLAGGSSDRGGGPEMKSLDCWHLKN